MKITIESEALDKLKAMAQKLQDERDELLDVVKDALCWGDLLPEQLVEKLGAIVDKCTSKPEVLA